MFFIASIADAGTAVGWKSIRRLRINDAVPIIASIQQQDIPERSDRLNRQPAGMPEMDIGADKMDTKATLEEREQRILELEDECRRCKADADAFRRNAAYYRSLVAGIHESVAVIGPDFTITDVNDAFLKASGYLYDAVVGRHCYEVAHGYNAPCEVYGERCALKEVLRNGEPASCLHDHRKADGSSGWVNILLSPLKDPDGNVTGVIQAAQDISDVMKVKEALVQNENKLRGILKTAPVGIGVVSGRKIVWTNQRLCEITGYAGQELENRPTRFLYPDEDEFQRVGRQWSEQIRRSGTSTLETRWIRKDGKMIDILLNLTPRDAEHPTENVVFSALDISERKAIETNLQRLALAIDHSSDMIVLIDTEGQITYVNPAFEKITGYSRSEALGHDAGFLQSERHDSVYYQELWEAISGGRTWAGRFTNLRKDGSIFTEEATISPVLSESGEIISFVAVKRDITEQLDLEQQLQQAQKMEAIGTLAGGISHDFNNILFPILGFAEMMIDSLPEEGFLRDSAQEILKAAQRAKELVRQILTFARQNPQEKKPVRVALIAKEALKLLRASLPSTIDIRRNITADSSVVMADATQVHQILMNLCTNAYHAMEDTGGELTVSLEEVRSADSENHLRLMVGDTGVGMAPEVMEKIFDPYFTTKEPGRGTGMGLSVVHGIVNSYGGQITVESIPGKGTIFSVFLPLLKVGGESFPNPEEPAAPGGDERILLVDDEPQVVKMATQMLTRLGYRVTPANDSHAALEMFRDAPDAFDLLITDLTMPRMTGDRLARHVKEIRPALPVILFSGLGKSAAVGKFDMERVNAVLSKPVVKKDLARAIRQALDGGHDRV